MQALEVLRCTRTFLTAADAAILVESGVERRDMSASRTVRVVVADDHQTVLAALVRALEDEPGFEVVGSAPTGTGAVELARETHADLVVVDVQMPAGGAEAAEQLRQLRPPPVVVAISGQSSAGTLEDLLRAGVTGFVTKGHAGADLIEVLERCARGEVVLAAPAAGVALAAVTTRQPADAGR
jgi:two-component system NarL family response regulator